MAAASWTNPLPPPPSPFVDRDDLRVLAAATIADFRSRQVTARLWFTGPEGIGKTALAIHVARSLTPPEQVFFCELGGSGPGGVADPADVLAEWLRQLGRSGDEIPAKLAERGRLFRALTGEMDVLVVLDDVHDGGQIAELIPSSPRAVVILTSRLRHDSLFHQGFEPIDVGTLADRDAVELIERLVPARLTGAEPEAVRALAGLCGGLPIALSVAAARLRRFNERPFEAMVELLRGETRLEELRLGGTRVVGLLLESCYADLNGSEREAYRALGLHPGPGFSADVVAATLGVSRAAARSTLDDLVAANLLRFSDDGDYRFHHALIAEHALRQALSEDDAERRVAVVTATTRWYADRAVRLALRTSPRWYVGDAFTRLAPADEGRLEALTELEAQRANLLAAFRATVEYGLDDLTALLGEALQPWLYNTGPIDDLVEIGEAAVRAAHRPELLLRMRLDLGSAYEKAGRLDDALAEFVEARRLADDLGHASGAESATEWQGIVLAQQGARAAALDRLAEAWRIAETRVTDPGQRERMVALILMHRGRILIDDGRPGDALAPLERARAWFDAHDEKFNTPRTTAEISRARFGLGHPGEGQAAAVEAANGLTAAGFRAAALRVWERAAGDLDAAGHRQDAIACLRNADDLAGRLGLIEVRERIASRLAGWLP